MSPTTSEDELETFLKDKEDALNDLKLKISIIRKELLDVESEYVDARLQFDKIKEELRRFRLMYPKLCKNRT